MEEMEDWSDSEEEAEPESFVGREGSVEGPGFSSTCPDSKMRKRAEPQSDLVGLD